MQTHQDYSTGQGSDFMKMSPGEQDKVDPYQPAEGEHKKKSVVGKVKDKAKKLTTKIKDATKKKGKDEHGNEVDEPSSSSEGEEEGQEYYATPESGKEHSLGYEPTPEARKDGVVHGGEPYKSRGVEGTELSGIGQIHGVSDPSAPAAGESWPASHKEPRAATSEAPSFGETQKRQNEVASAFGGESAGVSAGLASSGLGTDFSRSGQDNSNNKSGAFNESSDYSKGTDINEKPGLSDEKVPEDIMKPSNESDQLQPVVDSVDSSGRDYVASEVTPPVGGEQQDLLTGTEQPTAGEGALNKSNSQKGWMQRATEGVTSVKNALLGSPKTPPSTPASDTPISAPGQDFSSISSGTEEQKTWTDKARETATSVKDTISSKLPTNAPASGTTDVPVGEQQNVPGSSPTVTSRAMETVTGVKDTVASKLGFGAKGPETAPTTTVDSETETQAQKPGLTQKVVDVKDTIASKLGYGSKTNVETGGERIDSGGDSGNKLFTPDEHDTALSQKITDMLTLKGSTKSGDGNATA